MASTSTPAPQSEIETAYAFDGIAPGPSSSTLKKLPCSVFINHRGPDVKHTLATDIYHALDVTGLGVFLDSKELELGDIIPAALQEAMSSASVHVAILLKDLGVKEIPNFDHIDKGKEILSKRLRSVPVLIVLDDVDHPDQVDALLPTKDSLGWRSLIIVTTRERDVLKQCNISSIYEMKGMDYLYAKQLFCWHAFLQPYPRLGFEELVDKFLSVCKGLPLSLKVLGGQLYCYSSKDYWEGLLHKITKILPKDIKNRLRVSYDALDEDEKQIFLDVACFFIGEDYMKAMAVWEESDWNGLCSWERLVNKCLVDLDGNNCIKMHDHLRDLGREIAEIQSPSRLWTMDQIMDIQKQEQEKLQIRGMILNAANKEVHKSLGFLRGMILNAIDKWLLNCPCFLLGMMWRDAIIKEVHKFPGFLLNTRRPFPLELKVFVVKGNYGDKLPIAKFLTKLAWLRCAGIALRNLPLTMENLRVLELYDCRELVRLWKDGPKAPQLKVLIIDCCCRLQGIPKSIELLKNLKKISLTQCWSLKNLPEEFYCLQSLEHLQLTGSELVSLPSCFGELRKLRHLDLSCSSHLRMLPDSFKQLKLLQHLDLYRCDMLALRPDILENMTELEYLNIAYSDDFSNWNVRYTNVQHACSEYRKLPMDIGQLSKLRVMKIASQALPESLGSLNHLKYLKLECIEVESLPLSFKQLINLQTLIINDSQISQLDFGRGPFTSSLCNLERIDLVRTKVYKISISEECCPRLITLRVDECQNLREVDILPITVEKIQMKGCPELVTLPSFAKLASLKVFELIGNEVEKLEDLQHCSKLEELVVENPSWEVPGIESLEQMQRLRKVHIFAEKITVVEGCIQKIQKQKWPEEMIICTKAVPGAGSLLNSLEFPNLSVLDSFENKARHSLKVGAKFSSNENSTMLCLVINCLSPPMDFSVYLGKTRRHMSVCLGKTWRYDTWMEEGKWIWIAVFPQHSAFMAEWSLFIDSLIWPFGGITEVEKGLLLRGEENNVTKAFYSTLARLGN